MRNTPRFAALLSIILAAGPAAATGRVAVPRVGSLTPTLYPTIRTPGVVLGPGGLITGAPTLNPHGLTASLLTTLPAAAAAPALVLPAQTALQPAAFSAAAAADAPHAAPVAAALDSLKELAAPADGPRWVKNGGFDGARQRADAVSAGANFIINDEGVRINDRAAVYYTEVRRLVDEYKGKIDLEESLDVMDDAYGDVLAKVSAVEAVAKGRGLTRENTHLE